MIEKELIQQYVDKGYSFRKIGRELNIPHDTISWWANKYGIKNNYSKLSPIKINSIDTKEQAYMIGFLLGDSNIDKRGVLNCTIAIKDREILEFIAPLLDARIVDNTKLNKSKKQYPNSAILRKVDGLEKFFGGRLKEERHFPRITKNLERYLLLGFFDAEGCITFGHRKDRDRLWHKISFTSQYKMLEGLQKMLYKNLNISSTVKPKSDSNCFVLEFANKKDIITFLNYIYPEKNTFVVLKRKYEKAEALRLELG